MNSRYEHYFVIKATIDPNTSEVTFETDTDTLEARFREGAVWDEDEGTWIKASSPSVMENDVAVYGLLLDILKNSEGQAI